MTEVKMTPSDTKGENGEVTPTVFTGYVKIKVPRYKERIKKLRELGFKTEGNKVEAANEQVETAEKMLDLVDEHVTEVKLKLKSTGQSINSMEELEVYKEGTDFINKIGGAILGGIEVGNVLNQPSSSRSIGVATA